jgi:hypothetical protein
VLYGCETPSLTLQEEHGVRVIENSRQRKIRGPKRNEHEDSEDAQRSSGCVFHAKYSLIRVIKSRTMKWTEHEALRGRRETHRVLVK